MYNALIFQEQELLSIHQYNLRAYMLALQKVVDDETLSQREKNFVPEFENIESLGHNVLDRLEAVVSCLWLYTIIP